MAIYSLDLDDQDPNCIKKAMHLLMTISDTIGYKMVIGQPVSPEEIKALIDNHNEAVKTNAEYRTIVHQAEKPDDPKDN